MTLMEAFSFVHEDLRLSVCLFFTVSDVTVGISQRLTTVLHEKCYLSIAARRLLCGTRGSNRLGG